MEHEPLSRSGEQEFAEQFGAPVYNTRYYGNDGDRRWSSTDDAVGWMRYCLGRAASAGAIAVLMPASAATNRQARPLRSVLLRHGALRAIVSGLPDEQDLWLLGEPDGVRPDYLLLVAASQNPAAIWQAFQQGPTHPDAAPHVVRIVDRLDERIDLTPAEIRGDQLDRYPALRTELEQPVGTPPLLEPNAVVHATVSLGELAEAGAVSFLRSPPTVAAGDGATPMLTVKDVRLGRPPSRQGDAGVPGAVLIRSGDVAVVPSAPVVRECTDDGVLLGPGIELVRADAKLIDSRFLAGVLRVAVDRVSAGGVDLYDVGFPRLPLAEQGRYANAFTQLQELEQEWHRRRGELEQLVRIGFEGLATGRLRPSGGG
ncbi:hypothetical protein ABIA39_001281 [Nocardia sp. GAS34]|uniref:hypothetical protein n=1 Tax=unclassified Nocardia TaxID=2637762 RepID=UPI003D2526BA